MRSLLPISLSLLLLSGAWQKASAQLAPAADFFNSGAQFYISNNIPQAKEVTEMGLKLYPEDDHLQKLEQLLNQKQQQQQQQNQQQQQQNQQDQKSKSDQQKNQQSQNQQQKSGSQDQQKQDEQKQNQANQQQQKNDQKSQDQQKAAAEKAQKANQNANGQPQGDQMTPDEAKRLLDAQKDNEQILPLKPVEKPRDPSRPVKDW